jgi:hypothetical protein
MKKYLKYLVLIFSIFTFSKYGYSQPNDTALLQRIRNFLPGQAVEKLEKREKGKYYSVANVNAFDQRQIPAEVKRATPSIQSSKVEVVRKGEQWLIKDQKNQTQYIVYKKNDSLFLEKPVLATYAIPFVHDNTRQYIRVTHKVQTGNKKDSLISCYSYFDSNGSFLGTESVGKIVDPRRMQVNIVEQGMTGTHQAIVGLTASPANFDYEKMWQTVSKIVSLEQIREFNLYFVNYRLEDNTVKPMVIINIWGPANPLHMPDALPEVLKNRIRIIYNPVDSDWMADNFL